MEEQAASLRSPLSLPARLGAGLPGTARAGHRGPAQPGDTGRPGPARPARAAGPGAAPRRPSHGTTTPRVPSARAGLRLPACPAQGLPPSRMRSRGRPSPGTPCALFLNDTERLARVRPGDTVGALKRAYFPGQEQQVRLIYQGQLLRDDTQSLAALHLTHNSVLHCHISQHSPAPAPGGPHASADPVHTALNVGSLMLPLFVLMLAVLWYFQLQYRHVFTATATTFLAGLTLLFSFMAFTMYRR
uniref:Transmembrane and ubiquitin-like domain-containing protein 1 n=1 Tax=Apteryx owenii TaxID=8824 RepID=A0A8B9Q6P2_APTOW